MSEQLFETHQIRVGNGTLELIHGDITMIPVDAVVNAANSQLTGGGGVDGAIHRAGGSGLMRELDAIRSRIRRCQAGSAVVTSGGNLPARFVFHTVGPIYQGGRQDESKLLASCYRTCLSLAEERALESISFPSISTGVYGYPIEDATAVALTEVTGYLLRAPGTLRRIVLVQFSRADHEVYLRQARLFLQAASGEGIGAV